ncbi:MAG: peptidoglycan-binding protein [Candidatus Pacebacteria bacterium]|nr:peptidoglycan-binding protein [Candidatus Paceibacterota bacterium]
MCFKKQKFVLIFFIFSFLFLANGFSLAKSEGEQQTFFVEKSFDQAQRDQVQFRLVKISSQAYFYIENDWYLTITDQERGAINQNLAILADSFDKEIYPKLTGFWGPEWTPGIDNDPKITIVFEQLVKGAAGYFNDANEYLKQQAPFSNEKEMVYLSIETLKGTLAKSYLAHEFTHLITFNQKDRLRGAAEDIWLNEARAEYSPFYLGYDSQGQYTNLQQRINDFSQKPFDSLIIWNSEQSDYGVVDMFIQYLSEKYGRDILVQSLQSKKTGADSIDEALIQAGVNESFLQIFNNWAIAVFFNDCSLDNKFCFKNQALANLRIPPNLIVLPSMGKTNLSLNYSLLPWSSNWYKFIGSEGDLKITFNFDPKAQFILKYVLCEIKDGCKVFDLDIGGKNQAELLIKNFNSQYLSLSIIPSVKPRFSNTASLGDAYSFSVLAQTSNEPSQNQDEALIKALLAQIEQLKAQIAKIQAQLLAMGQTNYSCSSFQTNLYFGLQNNQVSCLQEFLKQQGSNIYPQGIVSGYFGSLTLEAVIKFQEKYAIPNTGYVGVLTRTKINELLKIK